MATHLIQDSPLSPGPGVYCGLEDPNPGDRAVGLFERDAVDCEACLREHERIKDQEFEAIRRDIELRAGLD